MNSLPLVVIVHGSQDNNALATIIWDCAFCEPVSLSSSFSFNALSFFFPCHISAKNLYSGQCSSHFSLTVSIRTEFHLWFPSMFHGGWCTALSTASSLPRSRPNTTWTNATSTSWPRKSLISQTITATSATWWFPGPSLIRSAQGYCSLTQIYTVEHELCSHT